MITLRRIGVALVGSIFLLSACCTSSPHETNQQTRPIDEGKSRAKIEEAFAHAVKLECLVVDDQGSSKNFIITDADIIKQVAVEALNIGWIGQNPAHLV